MQRNHIPFWIALLILMALVITLAYARIDSAVTIDYQHQELLRVEEARRQLVSCLNTVMIGKTTEAVITLLRKNKDIESDVLQIDGDRIEAGYIIFEFNNGLCTKVSTVSL